MYLTGQRKRLIRQIFLIAIGFITLMACAGSRKDESFLIGEPCYVPCWQEITPGITSEEDATRRLNELEIIKQDSIARRPSSTNIRAVTYNFHLQGGMIGNLLIEDSLVYRIRLAGLDMTIEEIISTFGEPELLLTRGHALCFEVDIFYLSQGMWFDGRNCESQFRTPATGVEIEPSIELYALHLFIPNQSEDVEVFMRDVVQVHPDYATEIATCGEKWIGFTTYSVPCSPLLGG